MRNRSIRITSSIWIDEREIQQQFVCASGPGGQNVNKVATAVQLRFNVRHCPSLPEEVRQRLIRLAGKRISTAGVLTIKARRYRTQERNRQDAIERLIHWIRRAAQTPKTRHKTKPTQASKQRRAQTKQHRSQIKQSRRPMGPDDD